MKFNERLNTFEQEMSELLEEEQNLLRQAFSGIRLCKKFLLEFKGNIAEEDFENTASEIHFFKFVKPAVMSSLIFFSEVRSCEIRKPKAGTAFKIRFFQKQLKKINKFFYRNSDFVQYMELGNTSFDHEIFTRKQKSFPYTPLVNDFQVPEFCTSHDMLWAEVKAMHRLIPYVRRSLEALTNGTEARGPRPRALSWTASKTSLIELIYALYSEGSMNHGKADLKTIASAFESFFNVNLDNLYKTYSEIKERRGSKTKFLEELMLHLEQKISREDGL